MVEAALRVKRVTRTMSMYQFVLAMVLAAYVGFTLDTDTTVDTLFGNQMGGPRASTPRTRARRAIRRS
jgi:hypothetical protein